MTVTTIFADPSDGYSTRSSTVYLTARASASGVNTTATSAQIGQRLVGTSFTFAEGFFGFDTSSISTDVVSVAVLAFVDFLDTSDQDAVVEARLHDWGPTLDTADAVPGDNLGTLPLLATYDTADGWTGNTYKDFTTVDLATLINGAGVTYMVLATDRQRLANVPVDGVLETAYIVMADTAGTTSDPKLTITHAPFVPIPATFGEPRSRLTPNTRRG